MVGGTEAAAADDIDIQSLPKGSVLCYRASRSTSSGIWLGDDPMDYSFPLMLAQITIIFTATRMTHAILRHLGQPRVVSEIIAGILMGPSLLTRNAELREVLFPKNSWMQLDLIAILSLMVFTFVLGVKTEMGVMRECGKKVIAISLIGTILPFLVVSLTAYSLRDRLPPEIKLNPFVLSFSGRWGVTSNIVLACLLEEFNLLTSKLGRLAMSVTLIEDFVSFVLGSIAKAVLASLDAKSTLVGFGYFACFMGYIIFIVFIARPLTQWMIGRTPEGRLMTRPYFLSVMGLAIMAALMSEVIGQQATLGPLLLGLALPGGPPLGTTLVDKLDRVFSNILLPVYVAVAGVRANVFSIDDAKQVLWMDLLILLSVISRFLGVMVPCLCCKIPLRDAFILGLMLNCKGLFEIYVATIWVNSQMINGQIYAIFVFSIVLIGGSTAAMLKLLYKPSMRFKACKKRTIQQVPQGDELRVLACVHNQENVAPIVALIQSTYSTTGGPICVYVLHLAQLAGRVAAVLKPYKKSGSSKTESESDHIVKAFRFLEHQKKGRLLVMPFVSISPFTSMHDDICTLAIEKKANLVIIPFHKHTEIGGSFELVTPGIQTMNINVLNYAPCSVGILIDHDSAYSIGEHHYLQKVAMYFLGGADDREALSYASRMAKNPIIALTLVRFLVPQELRRHNEEDNLDDEAVKAFKQGMAGNKQVMYREAIVKEGAETVGVIRGMSSEFSLFIVGRRQGKESLLTSGLEMWSEYPELGIIGDILASTKFEGKVSTLVVQEQSFRDNDQSLRPHTRFSLKIHPGKEEDD